MPANLLFAAYFLIRDKKRCICAYCQYRNKNIQTTLILCAFFLLFCYYISLLLAFKAQSKLYKMCKSQLISILHYKSVCDGLKFSSSSKLFAEGPSRNFRHPAVEMMIVIKIIMIVPLHTRPKRMLETKMRRSMVCQRCNLVLLWV